MINLKPNQMNPYRSGRSASISDWPEITYFVKLISNIFRLVDRGHDPRHGIWNDPVRLACQCIILSEFTQSRRLQNRKQNMCRHLNTSERKWRQPRLQLITKFRGRQEMGLPTLSAAVHLRKMMLRTMFRAMQTFVNGKFTKRFHFCVH